MTLGTISVVVVNRNRRELLTRTLRSLMDQTVAAEIIVVDNGSTDGSLAVFAGFPMAGVVYNPRNLGFCSAANQGIRAARGEFIALLNNDAEADRQWLASLADCFVHSDVGMAASKIVLAADTGIIDKAGHLLYPDGQNRGRGTGERDCGQYDREEEVLWPDGCAAMYRRSMLDDIGGFDEDLFAYGDDAELGLRARIAGWRCIYTPRAVVRHHRAASPTVRRVALIERNRVLLALRHFPLRLLWRNPYYYLLRLASGLAAAARGEGETALFPGALGKVRIALGLLLGDFEALIMTPRTLAKRWGGGAPKRLRPNEVARLILEHRISLAALSTRVAATAGKGRAAAG